MDNRKVLTKRLRENMRKSVVLVVCEDVAQLEVTKRIIKEHCRFVGVRSAEMAIRYLQDNVPDAIIYSHGIHDIEWPEFVKIIRNNPKICWIPLAMEPMPVNERFFADKLLQLLDCAYFRMNYVDVSDIEVSPWMVYENEALKNCGSKELFLQAAHDFIDGYQDSSNAIREFFEKKDIKNYTIRVHALKSEARFIGALGLSERAAYLEKCGKDDDIESIGEKTGELLTGYEIVMNNVRDFYCRDSLKKSESTLGVAEAKAILEELQEYYEAGDEDSVSECLEMLKSVPDSVKAQIENYNQIISLCEG